MRYIIFEYGAITLYGSTFPDQILLITYFSTHLEHCHILQFIPTTPFS